MFSCLLSFIRGGRNRTDCFECPRLADDRCPSPRRRGRFVAVETWVEQRKLLAACSVSQTDHFDCQQGPTVGREVLEPSSPSLQLGATPSQLPTRNNNRSRNETARCPVRDTGLLKAALGRTADVTCAGDTDSVRRSIRYALDPCRTHD